MLCSTLLRRKKSNVKIQQLEESLQSAQSKASNLEKLKNRLNGEVEDLNANLEDVSYHISHINFFGRLNTVLLVL